MTIPCFLCVTVGRSLFARSFAYRRRRPRPPAHPAGSSSRRWLRQAGRQQAERSEANPSTNCASNSLHNKFCPADDSDSNDSSAADSPDDRLTVVAEDPPDPAAPVETVFPDYEADPEDSVAPAAAATAVRIPFLYK